ncbi:MAG: cell division protein ZapA [Sphingobacteriales bacterium]|nr:cell division protein ZapA [Sphingobacteriales bacterium]
MNKEIISIILQIAERPYPLKIKADEEEIVRKAGKIIKEKMAEFKAIYPTKETIDHLAMACLMICVDGLSKQYESVQQQESLDKIEELEEQLTVFLKRL